MHGARPLAILPSLSQVWLWSLAGWLDGAGPILSSLSRNFANASLQSGHLHNLFEVASDVVACEFWLRRHFRFQRVGPCVELYPEVIDVIVASRIRATQNCLSVSVCEVEVTAPSTCLTHVTGNELWGSM